MLQRTLTAIVQQHHKPWSLIKLPRETEKTKEEEVGEEERREKGGFSTWANTERVRTLYTVFHHLCAHAQALTRVGVGRLPFTINLFALFELYIRCINYLPKGFILKMINANTVTLLNCLCLGKS